MITTLVKNHPAPASNMNTLSLKEACLFMNLPADTLRLYMAKFRLPHHYWGKKVFFRKSELQEWLGTSDYSFEEYRTEHRCYNRKYRRAS
ncbi:hypothetical protein GCM10023093_17740 [Nemorincola caseinilytica]|uniref:Helix-turn-helix domain-containing protein n=1 Tax=Nemorincola caseinilytica TaxID=2054315 RepID=A0ABP8NDF1_9BACT